MNTMMTDPGKLLNRSVYRARAMSGPWVQVLGCPLGFLGSYDLLRNPRLEGQRTKNHSFFEVVGN